MVLVEDERALVRRELSREGEREERARGERQESDSESKEGAIEEGGEWVESNVHRRLTFV